MRSTRRRRFVGQLDNVMEILYRVYIGAIFGAIALAVVAGIVHDTGVGAKAVDEIADKGPALLGAVVSLAALAGLRSGSRGGPLAIEDAEVQYVLLAPVDRGMALRPAALRQMRVGAFAGAVLGAVAGNFAFRRLPGSPVEWLACLALFGALIPLSTLGCALLASGRRLRPAAAATIGAVLLAWSLADVLLGLKTSPATMLGVLATLPLQNGASPALALAGVVVAVAAISLGLVWLSGLSLEAARRRATLTDQLRFSASVQDLRAVVLLRRQLASELPRRRPWLRLRAPALARWPISRRDVQSFLRWPGSRLVRSLAVGAAAGAIIVGAWSGTTPLVALAGVVMLLPAFDVVEPLAQEVDHPLRRNLLPVKPESLILHHLIAPAVAMGLVLLAAVIAATALGGSGTALGVGAVMIVPTAFVLLCCAAISATNDPYKYVLTPNLGYAQTAAPIVVALVSVAVPVLVAREVARHGGSPEAAVAGVEVAILMVGAVLAFWLGVRLAAQTAVKP
jgi:hypothetical protein